jgi:hypothetical protein
MTDPKEDELERLRRENEVLKRTILHLADIHAATAFDGMLASASKSRRRRMADICDIATEAVRYGTTEGSRRHAYGSESAPDRVLERLAETAAMLREKC